MKGAPVAGRARRGNPEHQEQAALIQWHEQAQARHPELRLLFAVPNGGARPGRTTTNSAGQVVKYSAEGQRLKAEGVKSGVPDLMLPVMRGGFGGLFVEMKAPGGSPRPDQRAWLAALAAQGYMTAVCDEWTAAARVLTEYLNLPAAPVPDGNSRAGVPLRTADAAEQLAAQGHAPDVGAAVNTLALTVARRTGGGAAELRARLTAAVVAAGRVRAKG